MNDDIKYLESKGINFQDLSDQEKVEYRQIYFAYQRSDSLYNEALKEKSYEVVQSQQRLQFLSHSREICFNTLKQYIQDLKNKHYSRGSRLPFTE